MFSFPLEKMVGGIFYEHGHRHDREHGRLPDDHPRGLDVEGRAAALGAAGSASIALGAVILQGLLGGLTVLFLLPAPVSIGHAGLAQLFFCITVSLALFTSPGWRRRADAGRRPDAAARRARDDGR